MFLVRVPGAAGPNCITGGGSSRYLPALISVPQPHFRAAGRMKSEPHLRMPLRPLPRLGCG
jgi:hypothetical protein